MTIPVAIILAAVIASLGISAKHWMPYLFGLAFFLLALPFVVVSAILLALLAVAVLGWEKISEWRAKAP